jgi:PEP-CTERM/exosortase A-associated glycosyltransferase
MTLRILHILDHSIPLQSGYAFRTRAIIREQRRQGWDTIHLTSPKHAAPSAQEEEVEGLRFHRTPWQPSGAAKVPVLRELALMRATEQRIEELLRQTRVDVLHAHSPVLNAIPALRVGRRRGIPVLYEVRAFWEDAAVDLGTTTADGWRYRATRALETHALKRADHVTTICDGLKRDIVARGVPEAKVTVIPNAVDIDAFPFSVEPDPSLNANLGLEGKTVIGFLGSFYAYEGLDLLLEAHRKLLDRLPDVRLLLVGGGPQENALKAQAQQLGLQNNVVFAGRIPHRQVWRYYSIIDVLAYPRRSIRLTELVTPLKPLEAMAQGKLLVASDVGGHRELISDGETGLLFPPDDADALADAIERLIAQRAHWQEMRLRARRFVERERNWRGSVARYADIFAGLTGAAR